MNLIISYNVKVFLNAAQELMHWSDSLMAFISSFNAVIIYLLR